MRHKIWRAIERILTGIWFCSCLICLLGILLALKEMLTGNVKEGITVLIGSFVAVGVFTLIYEVLENVISTLFTLDRKIKGLFNKNKSSSSYSSSRSSSSSSWYSGSYEPSSSHDSGYDDVIAAAGAQEMSRVTAYYGEDWKGYDPEAIQPWEREEGFDPEVPQPWDTDWSDAE